MKRKKVNGVGRGRYLRQAPMIGRPTTVAGADKMQIAIRFDPDLFLDVLKFARKEKQSFNEAVAHLCEWGLEAVTDERIKEERNMTNKQFTFNDTANGIRIEENDYTIQLSMKEAALLSPTEAETVARSLSTAAGRVRASKILRNKTTLGSILLLVTLGMAATIAPARAQGRCMGVRDFNRRQACIAVQGSSPADCASIRDQSDRELCRIRAQNHRELRDPTSYPRYPR